MSTSRLTIQADRTAFDEVARAGRRHVADDANVEIEELLMISTGSSSTRGSWPLDSTMWKTLNAGPRMFHGSTNAPQSTALSTSSQWGRRLAASTASVARQIMMRQRDLATDLEAFAPALTGITYAVATAGQFVADLGENAGQLDAKLHPAETARSDEDAPPRARQTLLAPPASTSKRSP